MKCCFHIIADAMYECFDVSYWHDFACDVCNLQWRSVFAVEHRFMFITQYLAMTFSTCEITWLCTLQGGRQGKSGPVLTCVITQTVLFKASFATLKIHMCNIKISAVNYTEAIKQQYNKSDTN